MKFLKPVYWLTWVGIAGLTLLWLLPAVWRDGLAAFVGRWYSKRQTRHRFHVVVNLRHCHPDWDAARIDDFTTSYFESLCQILVQLPLLWFAPTSVMRRRIQMRGWGETQRLLDSGQPVIFMFSHAIALDFGIIRLSSDVHMQGIYKPLKNPVLDWLVRKSRAKFGGIPVPRGEGMRATLKRLKQRVHLIYLGDEALGDKGAEFAPFFAGRKATLTSMARMVELTGAAVVPVYTHYDPGSRQFTLDLLPALEEFPASTLIASATQMNQAIEASVAIKPEQYMWKLRFFKTAEAGGDNIYQTARNAADR